MMIIQSSLTSTEVEELEAPWWHERVSLTLRVLSLLKSLTFRVLSFPPAMILVPFVMVWGDVVVRQPTGQVPPELHLSIRVQANPATVVMDIRGGPVDGLHTLYRWGSER